MIGQFHVVTRFAKRCLDIVLAGSALAVLSIPMLGIYIAVRQTMGSPALFRQRRPGRHGTIFTMIKFRTMNDRRHPNGQPLHDSVRLTQLGRLLRKTSLDELPELLNVLGGSMSLVGPRPLLESYLPLYTDEQARRHEVKPGITGWAQVNGRQHITFSKRFELDVWYVDNVSIWLDLKILALTVLRVFASKGVESGQNVADVDDVGFSAAIASKKAEEG